MHSLTQDHVDDAELTRRLRALASNERAAMADFVVHLAEFDQRRLYLQEGCSSLYTWLTDRLRLSNASAYRRVTAARLQQRMPVVAAYLRDGRVTLTKLAALRDVLVPGSCEALLDEAAELTERDVETLAVSRGPQRPAPPPRDTIRPVPRPRAPSVHQPDLWARPVTAAPSPSEPRPVCHEITMTVGPEFLAQLREVRAALSHSHPGATLEALLGECMKVTIAALRKRVEAAAAPPPGARAPTKPSRYIPAEVRRQVWARDGRRCAFVADDGHRCGETHGLEIHHVQPFALGGPSTDPGLLKVLCREHNLHLARRDFGPECVDRHRAH
jgi:hypothetical protein